MVRLTPNLSPSESSGSFAPGSLDQAERRLQESIAADPNYALSYVVLADVYLQSNIYGNRPSRELAAKANAAVHKAAKHEHISLKGTYR